MDEPEKPILTLTHPPSDWFGQDDYGYDPENGRPGVGIFSGAVQVWSICQERAQVTVAEAAAAFKVPAQVIMDAVEHHNWLYLDKIDQEAGDTPENLTIEHEGE